MLDWIAPLRRLLHAHTHAVLVTVVETAGSAPREVGARMIVTGGDLVDTIGGGNLEYRAISQARSMLADKVPKHVELYGLGPTLNQCCGGAVRLLFERIDTRTAGWLAALQRNLDHDRSTVLVCALHGDTPATWAIRSPVTIWPADPPCEIRHAVQALEGARCGTWRHLKLGQVEYLLTVVTEYRTPLYLFGAGHVGRAVVRALAWLPFRIRWFDSRPAEFPVDPPANAEVCCTDDPFSPVRAAAPGAFFLIMTHSHALDYALCRAILERADIGWLGLIGSRTKQCRFQQRLLANRVSEAARARLICPIGMTGIASKRPAVIAAAVAAQLLIQHEAQAVEAGQRERASHVA